MATTASSPLTLSRVIHWVVGIAFTLTGLAALGQNAFKGILLIACAALLIPPTARVISSSGLTMSRWSTVLVYIVGFILMANTAGQSVSKEDIQAMRQKQEQQAVQSSSAAPVIDRSAAEKELKDFMALAAKAQLVDSYEFSDMATVVYVGPMWYTQTVTLKKDFLAKVAMLKEAATGYKHFEARDAHSNEKVGEVTAFTQSLEVYK